MSYFLIKLKQPFYNGKTFSPIAIARIYLTVGSSVYSGSSKDVEGVNQIVKTDISKIQSEVIPRMEVVMKNVA